MSRTRKYFVHALQRRMPACRGFHGVSVGFMETGINSFFLTCVISAPPTLAYVSYRKKVRSARVCQYRSSVVGSNSPFDKNCGSRVGKTKSWSVTPFV
jgi:hypothetical protein